MQYNKYVHKLIISILIYLSRWSKDEIYMTNTIVDSYVWSVFQIGLQYFIETNMIPNFLGKIKHDLPRPFVAKSFIELDVAQLPIKRVWIGDEDYVFGNT